ncbi:MAG: hypothetical protein WC643_01350 [Parcubacteria group bacterium]|jgi:lipopolysaccharide export LptBFGC system permease protein LptF
MTKQEKKEEDSIHLRAVKYGYLHPNGFSYKGIAHHYSKRSAEWEVVKEFLHVARNNKDAGLNHITPFVLLQRNGSAIDDSIFVLSYEAFFNYLDYLELQQARKSAKDANFYARIAIGIAALAFIMSALLSLWQINHPIKINKDRQNNFFRLNKHNSVRP